MTTLEMIEQARKCADSYGCDECLYYNVGECNVSVMMERLADRLEKAYEDLQLSCVCANCKFFEGATTNDKSWVCEQCHVGYQYAVPTNWRWRGDDE